jgi:hypothetical protein
LRTSATFSVDSGTPYVTWSYAMASTATGTNASGSGRSIASTLPVETSWPSQSWAPMSTSGPFPRSTACE